MCRVLSAWQHSGMIMLRFLYVYPHGMCTMSVVSDLYKELTSLFSFAEWGQGEVPSIHA